MNSRQRVLNILNRKDVDRIPVDLWYTPEVAAALKEHFKVDSDLAFYKALGLDKIVWVNAAYPDTGDRNIWGSVTKSMDAGQEMYLEVDTPGLKGYETVESLADYPYWPDPDKYDYETAAAQSKQANKDYATLGPWISFFEVYCGMRGLEQSMMDLALSPNYVQAALDRIEDCQTQMLKRFLEKADDSVDMVFISDDMGSQNGLMMSLGMWDSFIKDRMKRWCDLIHSYNAKVFYHSDGAMETLTSRLIEIGVDVLNPIQHVCPGMDMAALKDNYGKDLIFHGGVDNQSVLPFETPEDVKKETINCLETLGRDRQGYICCSCHNVQAGTPVENIIAMAQTVQDYYK